MSKRNKKHPAQVTAPVSVFSEAVADLAPDAESTTAAADLAANEQPVRRSLQMAREANASNAPVAKDAPTRAHLVRPAKGENPERRRVFGYDNGPGGKVPVTAKVVVVNAASLATAYPLLAGALESTPDASVADIKTAGVSGKSFRRAFRSGLIRFSQE